MIEVLYNNTRHIMHVEMWYLQLQMRTFQARDV